MTGTKFQKGSFYKNRGDCCDFVEVHEVLVDSGFHAEIKVTWYTQNNNGWRKLCNDHFEISKNNYPKWMHYTPRGERQ